MVLQRGSRPQNCPEYRPMNYNPRRLFVASCLALITSAFSFQMRQNVADDMADDFLLTKQVVGSLMGGQFLGMAVAMLVFSPICDSMGMGKVLGLAWLCHLTGITGNHLRQRCGRPRRGGQRCVRAGRAFPIG